MKGAHAYFSGSAGIRLHYRCWDVPSPRAVVMVAHGLGEHSGRYEELAQDLARAGLSTYALDHRGHGRSDGRRGHVRRFTRYIHDFEKFRRRVMGCVGPDIPLVMLGHSLGGVILIRYLQEYPAVPARGAIVSAPALGVAIDVPRWKAQLARVLYYVVPALPMSTSLEPSHLTHDRQIVEAYERDPLVHDRVTPRLYGEMRREIEIAFDKAPRIRIPVLILVPSEDRITRPDQMQRFAAAVDRPQAVQVVTFPGLYHEVLNEISRSSIVADLLGWIERRIGPEPRAAEPGTLAG
jgi:alpha-beta hydrolase superfamily lysophospholipase